MLGRRLADSLVDQGCDVSGISRSAITCMPSRWKSLVVPRGASSPTDLAADVVINCAGPSAIWTETNPDASIDFRNQHWGFLKSIMKTSSATRIINFSTFHVYSSQPLGPISERLTLANQHPYAQNHAWMENALTDEYPVVNFRLSNSFGFSRSRGDNYWTLLTHDVLRQLAISGSYRLRGNPNSQRDFIPLTDVVNAVVAVMESDAVGPFNLASGKTRTVIEWSRELHALVDKTADTPLPLTLRNDHLSKESFQIDISKLQEHGWTPSSDVEGEVLDVFRAAGL